MFGLYLLVVQHSPDYAYFWLLPIAFLALYFFTAALAVLMSAITVYMRDMEHFILIILQLWFFLSPIVYSYEHSIAPQAARARVRVAVLLQPDHAHHADVPANLLRLDRWCPRRSPTVVVGGHAFPAILQVLPSWPMSTYFYLDIALLGIMIVVFLLAEVLFGRLQGNFESEL